MAVLLTYKRKSGAATITADASSSRAQLLFTAVGSRIDAEVHATCQAVIPVTYLGFYFQSYSIDHQGGGVWFVEANYSPLQPKKPGESSYAFDTTAKTEHIQVSKGTIASARVNSNKAAPNFKGVIGVNGDSIDGVDVKVPTFSWSETHYVPADLMAARYKLLLFQLTATMNDVAYKGLAAGENLFLGASGSLRGSEFWEMSYKFDCSANAYDIPIPGTHQGPDAAPQADPIALLFPPLGTPGIPVPTPPPIFGGNLPGEMIIKPVQGEWAGETIPFKAGWDYLWYLFGQKVAGAAGNKSLVRVPEAWYIEQVYYRSSHLLLGIGA